MTLPAVAPDTQAPKFPDLRALLSEIESRHARARRGDPGNELIGRVLALVSAAIRTKPPARRWIEDQAAMTRAELSEAVGDHFSVLQLPAEEKPPHAAKQVKEAAVAVFSETPSANREGFRDLLLLEALESNPGSLDQKDFRAVARRTDIQLGNELGQKVLGHVVAALRELVEWCDPNGVTSARSAARQPATDERPTKGVKRRASNVNARMLAAMAANKNVQGWTAKQWAGHLKCSPAAVVGTATWKDLSQLRLEMRAAKAADRRRSKK